MKIIAFIVGLVGIIYAIYLLRRSIRLHTKGKFVMGTITQINWFSRRNSTLMVEFNIKKGKKIEFNAGGGSFVGFSPLYRIGNQVPVLYNPQNPTEATIAMWEFMWLPAPFFMIISAGFFAYVIFGK